ncbi:MAG: hypothetical protein RLZZ543_1822 [Bacteroidota bacterium]|jgi:hypothetical protein
MRLVLQLLSLAFLAVPYVNAQVPCNTNRFNDTFLDKLEGDWIGKGHVAREEVSYAIHAKWELNHQFFHISLSDMAKNPQYAAEIYIGYECITARYIVHWIDPFGGLSSETLGNGKASATGIDFEFNYPSGVLVNHFIMNSDSTWEMKTDSQNANGEWSNFGDVFMKRK